MPKFNINSQTTPNIIIACGFFLIFFCYHLIYSEFFPNYSGKLGHDYSLLFPSLLNGYYWFKSNTIMDIPWFTPSLCGGQPFFADVQSGYFSVVQILALFLTPLTSIYTTVLVFAGMGFWGTYLLLRQVFKVSQECAFLGATLFMFNGFYSHRMIVGHFGYHGIMLIPWVSYLLLFRSNDNSNNGANGIQSVNAVCAVLTGLIVAYWIQSGLASLMIPVSLTILAIGCMAESGNIRDFLYRSTGAAILATGLSASKLVAGAAFMGNFNRSHYLLPGINGATDAITLAFTALFLSLKDIEEIAIPKMSNLQWMLSRHEWEFGVTFVPILIIAASWLTRLRVGGSPQAKHSPRSHIALLLLLFILTIPLAVNIYTPEWNAILKQTPLIKSSSGLIRWWLIYIPIVIIYSAIELDRLTLITKYRPWIVAGFSVAIVVVNLTQDSLYYDTQGYDPRVVSEAYAKYKQSGGDPAIHSIGTSESMLQRNDTLVAGISQLYCYNPSFGYRLESLPLKTLHAGNIFDQTDGFLNLKNPACYIYPAENACQPGDHFRVDQRAQAELFAQYKPFHFEVSTRQKIANWITVFSLMLVLAYGVWYLISMYRNTKRA